jgi:hypothetical protein
LRTLVDSSLSYRISAEALEKILPYLVLARLSRTVLAPTPSAIAIAIANSCSQERNGGSTGRLQISVMLGTCLGHDRIPATFTS